MTTLTVFDQLTLHPFLRDLPAGWLQRLATRGRTIERPRGYRLFSAAGPAQNFWLLRTGEVELDLHVQGRGHIMLGRIHGDEVLGWSWLLPPYRWSLGAVVAEDIEGLQFDAVGVRRLIEEDPEFGRELMTRFLAVTAQRVHTARLRIAELYGYPADPAAPGPRSAE